MRKIGYDNRIYQCLFKLFVRKRAKLYKEKSNTMGKFKKFKKRGNKLNKSDIKSASIDELGSVLLELQQLFVNYKDDLLKSGLYTTEQIAHLLKEKLEKFSTFYSNIILDLRQPQSNNGKSVEQVLESKKVN